MSSLFTLPRRERRKERGEKDNITILESQQKIRMFSFLRSRGNQRKRRKRSSMYSSFNAMGVLGQQSKETWVNPSTEEL